MRYTYVENPERSSLLSEGTGNFEVISAEEKTSSAGNDMLKLILKVWDKDGNVAQVFDYLVGHKQMLWKIKHFCESIGKPQLYSESSPVIKANELLGLSGDCSIETQSKRTVNGKTYDARSVIEDYIPAEEKASKKEDPAKQAAIFDDDIPF